MAKIDSENGPSGNLPPFLTEQQSNWVNDLMERMTLKQKIGQLFQVAAFSTRDERNEKKILDLIEKYHIGGLTFFQGIAEYQKFLTDKYQRASLVPLFINIDAEWGLAMRLTGEVQYPYQMTLGAIEDNDLLKVMAENIAVECKNLGVQSPLAPVVDINSNPNNPVISFRSFGDDKHKVAEKAKKIMEGLQENNILAVAKHFPGHGDTDVDSHLHLPVLGHSKDRIEDQELYPFKYLIDGGLGAIMTAHMHVPAFDDTPNIPATLSKEIITGLLRKQLGFQGLIITDAMDMKGISTFHSSPDADKMALVAGNDIITNSRSVADSVEAIEKAISTGELTEEWLNEKVRRILAMKKWTGLDQYAIKSRFEPLHNKKVHRIISSLSEQALTVIKGSVNHTPKNKQYASLQICCESRAVQDKSMEHHLKLIQDSGGAKHFEELLLEADVIEGHFAWSESQGTEALEDILNRLEEYDQVLLSFHNVNVKPHNHFNIPISGRESLQTLIDSKEVTLVFFGNAYALSEIANYTNCNAVILTYQESRYMHEACIAYLTGSITAQGSLPVAINIR